MRKGYSAVAPVETLEQELVRMIDPLPDPVEITNAPPFKSLFSDVWVSAKPPVRKGWRG